VSLAARRHGRSIPALGPVVGVIRRAVPAAGFPPAVSAADGRPAAFAAVALQPDQPCSVTGTLADFKGEYGSNYFAEVNIVGT